MQRRAEHVVVDAAVRAVGVALVLADVLRPARGEVAAEDQVGQLQRRDSASSVRVTADVPIRSDVCTEPGRSTTSSGRRRGAGSFGTARPRRVARPAAERGLDLVEHARRRDVADDDEHGAVRAHPVAVQRAHLRRRVSRRRPPAAGRSSAYGCSPHMRSASALDGDRARARPGDGQPLDLAGRVRCATSSAAKVGSVSTHGERGRAGARRSGGEDVAADEQAVGVDADADRSPPSACTAAARPARSCCPAPVSSASDSSAARAGWLAAGRQERDAQPHLDERHARLADGDHPQPVGGRALGRR